ncbi:O-antigen polysaccharide polymerase Wzy [Thalassotalea piscium]|uniref:Oligosaccharide repeat unit polymerase n=1 Tax=Thalassotalea piscium TaxID=1230533 RepID=A0A7X0NJ64_9GAMM|nr:O-antigen polysaccharide polymerase Wzy [Thalassotalea piscium]MBB6544434.1 oligosaccharide repeat unit polymerase [Thalassotalea piscium]
MLSINNINPFHQLLYVIIIASIGFILIPIHFNIVQVSRDTLELITLFNWLVISVILIYAIPKGIWSISFFFFFTFSIFHGGLVFVSAIDMITDQAILKAIRYWYPLQETSLAIYLFNYTMVLYAITVIIFSKAPVPAQETIHSKLIKRLHHIGGLMLLFMVLVFFAIGFGTGALSSYGAYLEIVKKSPLITLIFVYIYLFIGMSIVFVAASYREGFGYTYFIVFAIWGLLAFKVGLRGEVMFPTAVTAAILGRRRIPLKTHKLFLAVTLMLFATIIVKNARISGDYSSVDNINPLNAIAEMGSSLRAIEEVITWRNTGFELLNGESYWAPIERQLALFLPIERLPSLQDKRLLNVVVMEKAGPIGFSPVAEAYANFGEKGIIIMSLVLGGLFAKLDRISSTLRSDILIGVAIIPLFVMIRNSFAFIPVQIFIGLVLAFIILQLAKVKVDT